MTLDDDPAIAPASAATPFRDFPWGWKVVLAGFTPIMLTWVAAFSLGPVVGDFTPPWAWIPITALVLAWMFAYPLRVVRRLPALPTPRVVLIEGAVAALSLPVVLLLFNGVQVLMAKLPRLGGSDHPFEPIVGSSDSYHPVALVILAVVAAPLAEEVFYRGMFYNALRRHLNPFLAALIQGLVFGLMHPFGLADRAGIASFGFCLAMLYEWRKTLLSPIFLHGLFNTLGLVVLFASVAVAANAPVLGVRGVAGAKGCVLTEVVPGGAAAEAGLRVGDVITGAGENSVGDLRDLTLIMRAKKVGDRVPIWFDRGGVSRQVEAALKARPKK